MPIPKAKEKVDTPIDFMRPDVQERLGAAVLEVFSKQDFHKANMRTIARSARVSYETIYKHFHSKESLLFSFLGIWFEEITERIADHLQGLEDIKDRIRKVFWLLLDYYERNPDVGKILFQTVPWQSWENDETFKQEKLTKLFIKVLTDGQAAGILNPNLRAGDLLDVIYGYIGRRVAMRFYRREKERLTDGFDERFEMIWRGISNPNREIREPSTMIAGKGNASPGTRKPLRL